MGVRLDDELWGKRVSATAACCSANISYNYLVILSTDHESWPACSSVLLIELIKPIHSKIDIQTVPVFRLFDSVKQYVHALSWMMAIRVLCMVWRAFSYDVGSDRHIKIQWMACILLKLAIQWLSPRLFFYYCIQLWSIRKAIAGKKWLLLTDLNVITFESSAALPPSTDIPPGLKTLEKSCATWLPTARYAHLIGAWCAIYRDAFGRAFPQGTQLSLPSPSDPLTCQLFCLGPCLKLRCSVMTCSLCEAKSPGRARRRIRGCVKGLLLGYGYIS